MTTQGHGRPLRIAYLVKRYPRFSETFIVNEILAHEEAGVELEIFSLYPPGEKHVQDEVARVRAPVTYLSAGATRGQELQDAIARAQALIPELSARLARLGETDTRHLYQGVQLAIEARTRGFDLIHAHFATASASVARCAAVLAGLPYSFTAHAKDLFHESVAHDVLAVKIADAACVVTVSDFNVAWLTERFPWASGHIHRIYNGLALDQFRFAPLAHARQSRTIVSVGRLVEKKGFDQLIDACDVLARSGVDFNCKIVGTGELESALMAQIERLGLQGRVRLLGARPRREVIEILRDAAVFAGSYAVAEDGNRDGLPTVLVEAMAVGTPCVATAVTGVPEVVTHEETGLLIAPNDVAALAQALSRVLEDGALADRLARAARRQVEQYFDIRRNTAEQRVLFEAITAARRSVAT